MRCIIPQITWHSREPVLSIDFDPSSKFEDGFYRLASGGADQQLLIWHIRDPDTLKPNLVCVAELKRHLKTINIVRFSPDGSYIASADDDAHILIWKCDSKTDTEEIWHMEKSLRRHLEDVSDLCWSPDGAFLVSGSVDNSAVLWDVKKGTVMHQWSEHVGFVNGVGYDPFNESVVTMCIDRSLRFFNIKSGKLQHKILKYPPSWLNETVSKHTETEERVGKDTEVLVNTVSGDKENEPAISNPDGATTEVVKKPSMVPFNRMFCDADDTFCRRMGFSPKGEFLIVPGGLLPPPPSKDPLSSSASSAANGDNVNITNSPNDIKVKKLKSKKCTEKPAASNNAIVIFCRNSITTPCAVIPTGMSFSTSIRFSPVYYERNRSAFPYETTFANPTAKSERTISCVARLRAPKKTNRVLMDMPYRLVYTVATNDSIIIGDTASSEPLAIIKNIHCTRITDVSWSPDGRVCMSSSTDGYCSIISFEKDELGVEYPIVQISSTASECFPITPPKTIKAKVTKKKEKKAKPSTSSPIVTAKTVEKHKIEKSLMLEKDEVAEATVSPKPTPPVKAVQKTTLLRWFSKKPKSEDEGNPSVDEKQDNIANVNVNPPPKKPVSEPEVICLDSDSCEFVSESTPKPMKLPPPPSDSKYKSPLLNYFKAANQLKRQEISPVEILKLQTAPIKNEDLMVASISENAHVEMSMEVDNSGCEPPHKKAKSSVNNVEKSSNKKVAKIESPVNNETNNCVSSGNGNVASPVSSSAKAKPPRRIQLITLSEAPKEKKGNLD